MLNIYFGEMRNAVENTSAFFNHTYLDPWITDPYAKRIIKSVDKATVLSARTVDSKALGPIPVTQLSGGTKTLLLILNDREHIFNASNCGDNCARWILDIAKRSPTDVTINLHHLMDFGNKPFEIRILNTGDVVHDMREYIVIAGKCLWEDAAQ